MKLSGGALFYALVISIVIAMLTCSVLLAGHYARLSLLNDAVKEEVVRNAASGTILASSDEDVELYRGKQYDLFDRGKDSVFIQKKPWGAFDVTLSKAHTLNFVAEEIALIGSASVEEDAFALCMADMDRPLSITGNTYLHGKCFLPRSGVERAYVEGSSYSGRELVNGTSVNAERFLPKYNEERVAAIKSGFAGIPGEMDSLVAWSEFSQHDSIVQSFDGNALMVSEKFPLRITNQFLYGQVCIVSSVSIYVASSAHLEQVILIAPRIEIEENTEGQFQAFSGDSLIVGKETKLHFPSVLAVIAAKNSSEFPELIIGEDCTIMGDVFGADLSAELRRHVCINVAKGTTVYGAIYSTDLIDLKATVYGSVTCTGFILKTNSAVYENHLMNAVIDRAKRKESFVSSLLFSELHAPKTIALWLH